MIPIVRVTMWPVNRKISKDKKDVNLITMTTKPDPGEEDVEEFVKCGVVDEFYHLEEEIGRGSYGTVKKCLHKVNGNVCAAKIIKTSNNNIRKDVLREITMMRKLAHHNRIVALYDAFQTPLVITMVMEYVPGGELFELIVKEEFLMEDEAIDYVRQILEALQFMHRKNIVHLDLKPENILCVSQNESRDIKLVDFGLARQLQEGCEVKSSFGTPDFVAPEVIRMKPISTSSDMWSLGVLTYVLLSGLMPFSGEDDNHTLVKVAKADWDFDEECFDDLSEDAKDFIEGLLEKEPSDRYTVDECLCHPWITHKKVVLLKIDTKKHKAWMAKRMWKKSINALVAVRRMSLSPLAAQARRRSMDSALTPNVPKESGEQTNTKEAKEKTQDGKSAMMTPPVTRPWRSYTDIGGSSNNADRHSSIKNMRDVAKEAVKLARNIQQAAKTEGSSESVQKAGLNGLTPPVLKIEDEPLINGVNTQENDCSDRKGTKLNSSYDDNKNNNYLIVSDDANGISSDKTATTSFMVKERSTSREFAPVVLKINKDEITKVEVNTETDKFKHSTQVESLENDYENVNNHPSTKQNQGNENSTDENEPLCIHSTRTKVSQNCFFVPQKITVQLDRCSINGETSNDQINLSTVTNKEGLKSPPISVSVSYNMDQPSINGDKELIKVQSSSFGKQDTGLAKNVKVRCKMDGEINWEENEVTKSGDVVTVKLDSYSNLELPATQASTAHLRRASTGSPAVAFRESLLQ